MSAKQKSIYCIVAGIRDRVDNCVVRTSDNPKELIDWLGSSFSSLRETCKIFEQVQSKENLFPLRNAKESHPSGSIGPIFFLEKAMFAEVKKYFPFPSNFDRKIGHSSVVGIVNIYVVEVVSGIILDALVIAQHTEGSNSSNNPSNCLLGVYIDNKSPFTILRVTPTKDVQQLEDFILKEFVNVEVPNEYAGVGEYIRFEDRHVETSESTNILLVQMDEVGYQEY